MTPSRLREGVCAAPIVLSERFAVLHLFDAVERNFQPVGYDDGRL